MVSEQFNSGETPSFELAGPREKIFFNPGQTSAAIVTCGGLCPGLNNVIRSLVMTLHYRYGVNKIFGIKYGYRGFIPKFHHGVVELEPKIVEEIHKVGGTFLGSSRGEQNVREITNFLEDRKINMLFAIGGDGTIRGALSIAEEVEKRQLPISIINIPKTIDNDISFIQRSFGFDTAVSISVQAIRSAHAEARGAYNGIGLVKLMGRHSGFIAATASLAFKEVNFVLIPELDFDLEGPEGFFEALKKRLENRKHAVVIIAEGAGQHLIQKEQNERDASGNIKLLDIGTFLRDRIKAYFKKINFDITLKYIDPSYMIRSAPAIPTDNIFCGQLAMDAVHAAMAGKTDMLVGSLHNSFTHLPIETATSKRKMIDLESRLWWDVLENTGQPMKMNNK